MKLTIYNTYVVMESQEQCDRMKQICIDNNLPYWDENIGFEFYGLDNFGFEFYGLDNFGFDEESKEFFVFSRDEDFYDRTKVTEQEFINLLNTK